MAPRWLAVHAAVLRGGRRVRPARRLAARPRTRAARPVRSRGHQRRPRAGAHSTRCCQPARPRELDDVGRPVDVSGVYGASAQLVVPGRELEGETGWLVLTPLELDDGGAIIGRPRLAPRRPGSAAGPAGRSRSTVSGWLGTLRGRARSCAAPGRPGRRGPRADAGESRPVRVARRVSSRPPPTRGRPRSSRGRPRQRTSDRDCRCRTCSTPWSGGRSGSPPRALWWSAVRRRPVVTPASGPVGP